MDAQGVEKMKAIVVDKDYGSVKPEEIEIVRKAYAKAGIELTAAHYTGEDEIIANCQDADIILATGNPPMTAKVMRAWARSYSICRDSAPRNWPTSLRP